MPNQTYRDFEIILVDDGSTDDIEEIVRSFNDDQIRYTCHDENIGAAAARNTGMKAALREYIAFQDSIVAPPICSSKLFRSIKF